MQKQIKHVEKFHDTFGIPNEYTPNAVVSQEIIALRHRLMAEENEEYLEAAMEGDTVEVAPSKALNPYVCDKVKHVNTLRRS